ncbi:MAG TPA: M14 family zinc carboxypeptidase, partial [Gammaproteobacteria bacterium]
MNVPLKAIAATLFMVLFAGAAGAEPGVTMLPDGGSYDEQVPKPVEVFGFEVGEQHVRHDQLVNYFRTLAESSDRVALEVTGRTYEGREQLLAIVSSPENIRNIEEIRAQHLAVARGEREPGGLPVILWQGYSIHGDEASGSNAVPLYAWHLAASQDPEVTRMLEDVVVLIDPSLNPDGMARFAEWTTSRRGETVVTDPAHEEHNQHWPSGRGNHYWFDLNRDWLLLQHPASRHRVAMLNRWRPHIVTDHHEMGSDSTFFFQPGVPDRTHPLTPARNQELTGMIAAFHGKRLDEIGRLYYTEESFDDFYYGKGSTYPDITGGIGILFEQASSEGQAIETPFGVRPFWMSVHNQLTASLSTLEAAHALQDELRQYQANFFAQARERADGAWVIGNAGNDVRMQKFLALLAGHGIRFAPLEERISENDHTFTPGNAWVVPMNQPQSRLIEAMFDVRTEFPSNTFYDVSTWTLPLAFDLPYARTGGVPDIGALTSAAPEVEKPFSASADAIAYAFEWQSDAAPPALQTLLENDVRVLAATKPLTVATPDGNVALDEGSVVVPLGVQDVARDRVAAMLAEAASNGVRVHAVLGGLTAKGVDLGSPSLVPLEPVKPLLVTGNAVSPYEAGEVWHFTDTRLGLPLTHVSRDRFARVDLDDYTHIILVHSYGGGWGEDEAKRLHEWMNAGGVLITQQRAADWATNFRLYLSSGDRR